MASGAQWLNWRCGLGLGVAREKIRVARALRDLPKTSRLFSEGQISYSKVRAMTRVTMPKNEEALLNVALHGTASPVEKQVQLYRQTRRIEALKTENERHSKRELSWRINDDGYWILRGRFTPEQGAVIRKALEKARDTLWEQEDPADDPQPPHAVAARRADALDRIADSYLAGGENDRGGGQRCLVHVHTDIDTLRADGSGAEAELVDCYNVSAETSWRIACDASVAHWRETANGEKMDPELAVLTLVQKE